MSEQNIKIREIKEGDYVSVVEKLYNLYREHSNIRPAYYNDIRFADLEKVLAKSDLKFIAVKNNNIVGFVRGDVVEKDNSKFAFVHDIFVDKKLRRKGVGALLMKEFYNSVKSLGVIEIRLQVDVFNNEAILFWENEGFVTTHYKMSKIV